MGQHSKKVSKRIPNNSKLKGLRHKELDSIKELFNKGNTNQGYSELIKYVERHPNDPYGHNLLGKIYIQRKQLEEAKEEFEKVIIAGDKNYSAGYVGIAQVYRMQGNNDEARRYYELAIENDTYNHRFPYIALAIIENEFGNYYRALNLLYTAAEIEDTSTMYTAASKNDAKIGIVKNLLALGKIEEAEEVLASITPESKEQTRLIAYGMGTVYKAKNEPLKGIKELEKIRNYGKKDHLYYQATLEESRLYQQLGDFDMQYALLCELKKDNITFEGVVGECLGICKLRQKDYVGAKEEFKDGMAGHDFNSRNLSAYYYSAIQYLEGNVIGAEETLKKALAANTSPSRIIYNSLIRVLYDQGKYEEAANYINEAVKLCTPKECVGFKRLGILVGKKLNKPLPKKDHLLYTDAQYVDYSLEDAIARNIETDKRDDRKSVFAPGVDIGLLYEEVQSGLTRDNQLMVTEQDEYIVPHENIGYVGDEVANNIKVITVPGTTQIISLYPYTEPLLPTRKVIEDSFAKKVQGNVMIKKFNERFEKFAAKSSSPKND